MDYYNLVSAQILELANEKECWRKVNSTDQRGRTALHYAAFLGNQPILELLLANGAEVFIQDRTGKTSLHYAAYNDSDECVAAILKYSMKRPYMSYH